MWFVVVGDRLVLTTAAQSLTARNLRRDPRVTLIVDASRTAPGRLGTRSLRLTGTAEVVDGLPPWPVMIRLAAKYYLDPRCAVVEVRHFRRWRLRSRYYAAGQAVWISVKPVRAEIVPLPSCD